VTFLTLHEEDIPKYEETTAGAVARGLVTGSA